MISRKLSEKLNEQINKEIYSAYLYQDISNYYAVKCKVRNNGADVPL